MSSPSDTLTPFGHSMLKHFFFDQDYKNLNHGSFGAYPRMVRDKLREIQDNVEARPDQFIRWDYPLALDESRAAMAKALNVLTNECVFVENSTSGINTIVRNMVFREGDAIVYFATVYGAIKKTIVSVSETVPVRCLGVEYQYPITDGDLVERFLETTKKAKADGLNVRIAIFDTIVSLPGIRFPFERLVEACRQEEVLSLVDGAHGIGQIHIDLGKLQPDFFVSNCHKWLYTPRGCAVLYVPTRNQHIIRTTFPTSWGFASAAGSPETQHVFPSTREAKTPFEKLFQFVATRDTSPYLCVPTALRFREEICGSDDRIYDYLENLAREAGDVVAAALGTEVLREPGLKPGELSQQRRCAMATVKLPLACGVDGDNNSSSTSRSPYPPLAKANIENVVDWMEAVMVNRYNTMVPVFEHSGRLWVRICSQIYLEKSDFEWLGGVLKELCDQVGRRQMHVRFRGKL